MPAKDPVVAICCILFSSKEATLPGMATAALGLDGEGEGEELAEGEEGGRLVQDSQPLKALPAMSGCQEKARPVWRFFPQTLCTATRAAGLARRYPCLSFRPASHDGSRKAAFSLHYRPSESSWLLAEAAGSLYLGPHCPTVPPA